MSGLVHLSAGGSITGDRLPLTTQNDWRRRALTVILAPEKRKVGSSILPLTTSCVLATGALNSANACWFPSRPQQSSAHNCPCVTVVSRSLSHVDRTPRRCARGAQPPD
jgi:hypothetical protein